MKIRLLNDIFEGVSEQPPYFFKHVSLEELGDVQLYYDDSYARCLKKGLETSDAKLARAIENGEWSTGEDYKINTFDTRLSNLHKTEAKLAFPQQKENVREQIVEAQKELQELETKKSIITYQSAEYYAQYWSFQRQLYITTFKDNSMKEMYWTQEEFDNLSEESLIEIQKKFIAFSKSVSDTNIKKLALMPFFRNMYLVASTPYDFFGKSVVKLTNNQIQLLNHAKNFDYILKNSKNIPPELYDDPDELEKWFIGNRDGTSSVMNKSQKTFGGAGLISSLKEKGSLGMNDLKKVL